MVNILKSKKGTAITSKQVQDGNIPIIADEQNQHIIVIFLTEMVIYFAHLQAEVLAL